MFIISPADVSDCEEVKKLIIRASGLPLSIVFVECAKKSLEKLRTLIHQEPVRLKVIEIYQIYLI